MNCPKCAEQSLEERLGPSGILVDLCSACGGVWLDKGEIYNYVRYPQTLHDDLVKAYGDTAPGLRPCPRCQVKMTQARFPAPGPVIDACPQCGGNWFDAGEVAALQSMLDLELRPEPEAKPAAPAPAPAAVPGRAVVMAALPSLALRSGGVLLALYAVLMGFCAAAVAYLKLPLDYIFIGSAAALLLSFILGPWFTDLSLRWFHEFRWVDAADLPEHLRGFISKACRDRGIPFPRCGIIDDGNPNAFTYGHYPGDARLVLTRGVMDILEPGELEAVAGHELGHIAHWDMLVMTAAALVPMVLYTIYKVCCRRKPSSSGSRKGRGQVFLIGMTALLLYYVTEYVVLFLSRVRELYADRFSGELTRQPNSLASALVKIAYGLAGRRPDPKEEESATHETVRALGIFDPVGALGLVAASLSRAGAPSKENILGAMQWDLWNPWAKYYELQSTHPLPARRLEQLGRQAAAYGQEPYVDFDLRQPESYWDEFLVDLGFLWLPWLMAGAAVLSNSLAGIHGAQTWWGAAAGWGAGSLCRLWFKYRGGFCPDMTVSAVLKKVKVSGVRGVPAALQGRVIGRGVPGFIVSEDLVLQDKTGFILLDYRQPLAVFQWIFAIGRVPGLIGQELSVKGWYRRAPVPYLELRSFVCDGKESTCYSLEGQYVFAFLALAAGVLGMLGMF
ncbi:MAG: M48 family metalloprotease [Elusimicrobia bacterium]|nr:M48 family metalloprotease [Elusimicrobiota bacterium]